MASIPLVIVGMSGGVDSSVAAWLLQRQGLRVEGLFMSNWEEDETGYCTAAQDYLDARRICTQLGIALHRVNFADEYRDRVFAHFLAEYRAGRTPNPDVLCNREIKFGVCFDYAQRLGADFVATGHYARRGAGPDGAPDGAKDQSYFLHSVPTAALAKTLFPIGELPKQEVRRLAREMAMGVHDKKDSTGICFIGERPFAEFLGRYLPAQPGDIESPDGRKLGRHSGLMSYTLGQRQGLRIGGRSHALEEPWYVAGKDLQRNVLVVVQGHDHPALLSDTLAASQLSWIAPRAGAGGPTLTAASAGGAPAAYRFRCHAKARYRQADQACEVELLPDGTCRVHFDAPQRAITPGQYVVFYQGDLCLGGGTIERSWRRSSAASAAA
jgi:tRNA-specific 2-thiouridylase